MTKVKIGEVTYEASVTPIYITSENTFSTQIVHFLVNGTDYVAFVTKSGKLVVNKPQ